MKTSKEFFDRLKTDEAFVKEVETGLAAKREAGAANYYETFIPVAADLGYEITEKDLDDALSSASEELSEEDLGKVSGGTSCVGITVGIILSLVTAGGVVAFGVYTAQNE